MAQQNDFVNDINVGDAPAINSNSVQPVSVYTNQLATIDGAVGYGYGFPWENTIDESDFYRFYAPVTGYYRFTWSSSSTDQVYFEVENEEGGSLHSGANAISEFQLHLVGGERYFLKILANTFNLEPGRPLDEWQNAYSLKIHFFNSTLANDYVNGIDIDDAGNNLNAAAEVVLNSSGDSSITGSASDYSDQKDFFKLAAIEAGTASITLSGLSQDLDLHLYDSVGTRLNSSTWTGNSDDGITYEFVSGEIYYIEVRAVQDNESEYSLLIDSASIITPVGAQDYSNGNLLGEVGNEFLGATSVTAGVNYQIAIVGSVGYETDTNDFYKFTTDNDGEAQFLLENLSDDINLRLFDADGIELAVGSRSGSNDESFTYNLVSGQTYTLHVDPNQAVKSNYDLTINLPLEETTSFEGEILFTMARFSRAAYHLRSDEPRTDINLVEPAYRNDESDNAKLAYDNLGLEWNFLHESDLPGLSFQDGIGTLDWSTGIKDGIFTNHNAAALVARNGDTLVIAFRGTNDAAQLDGNGDGDTSEWGPLGGFFDATPDRNDWDNKSDHYDLLLPLINAVDTYVADNNISQVFVTGHSLGGGMVDKFMWDHGAEDYPDTEFQAVTFASSGYFISPLKSDDRISNFVFDSDPIRAATWSTNSLGDKNTIDVRYSEQLEGAGAHAMDLYLAVFEFLNEQPFDENLLLPGGEDFDDILLDVLVVDQSIGHFKPGYLEDYIDGPNAFNDGLLNDGLGQRKSIIFGGLNDDTLLGTSKDDLIIGGDGNDVLKGNDGNDIYVISINDQGIDSIELEWGDIIRVEGVDDLYQTDVAFNVAPYLRKNEFGLSDDGKILYIGLDEIDGADFEIRFLPSRSFISSIVFNWEYPFESPLREIYSNGNEISIWSTSRGTVIDGYVQNADIYIDQNRDGIPDPDEFTGELTGELGGFEISTNLLGPIIAVGGYNVDTGLINTLSFTAPDSSHVITPMTTVIYKLIQSYGYNKFKAEEGVQIAFGILDDIDLTNFNPFLEDSATSLRVQKSNAQLALIGTLLSREGVDFEVVIDKISLAIINKFIFKLSDEETLRSLFPEVGVDVIEKISDANKKIVNANSLGDISEIQFETISELLNVRGLPEFLINQESAQSQMLSDLILLENNQWVFAWNSQGNVYGRVFDEMGRPFLDEFQVNTYVSGFQQNPTLTNLNDGGWVVVWESSGQDGSNYGVFGQRFDSDHLAVGTEFQVNTTTRNHQFNPDVSHLEDGGWIVVWESADGSDYGIFGQRFDTTGIPVASEFMVNTSYLNRQSDPSVTGLDDGGWFVVWESQGISNEEIIGQRYGSNGDPIGGEIPINTYTRNSQSEPAVESLSDGRLIVVWQSMSQDGSGWGVYGQLFDSEVEKIGSEFVINTTTLGNQASPQVSGLGDGGFTVSWESEQQISFELSSEIVVQRYDINGRKIGAETLVNEYIDGRQSFPAIAGDSSGGWMVTWSSLGQDGWENAVVAKRYTTEKNILPVGNPVLDGAPEENSILKVLTDFISDVDGLGEFLYQWFRDGIAVDGMTEQSYSLTQQDVGTEISVEVSYVDGLGAEEFLRSNPTSSILNINDDPQGLPVILGTAIEEETLTVVSTGITDEDGLGAFSYQWLRDGGEIVGATNNTYLLSQADVGSEISVEVSYIDGYGTEESLRSNPTIPIESSNTPPTVPPFYEFIIDEDQVLDFEVIVGHDDDGDELTYSPITGPSFGTVVISANGEFIYTPDPNFHGDDQFRVLVEDGNGGRAETQVLLTVNPVNDSPTGIASVSGEPIVGERIYFRVSNLDDEDGLPNLFTYNFYRDENLFASLERSFSNGSFYWDVPPTAVGNSIYFEVVYTDLQGTTERLVSSPVGPVTQVNHPPTGSVVISGAEEAHNTLLVNTSDLDDEDGLGTLNYQWLRDGDEILGATRSTYDLTNSDIGSQIQVRISFIDGFGTGESVLSDLTSTVTNMAGELVQGSSVADVLEGSLGDDTVSGGNGSDVFIAHHMPSQYTWDSASGILYGPEGADHLESIERIRFGSGSDIADVLLSDLVDPDGDGPEVSNATQIMQDITDLYVGYFTRPGDVGGMKFWFDKIYDGVETFEGIARGFTMSAEYARIYPDSFDNREFVQAIYNNLLGREPDEEGWEHWTNQLDTGLETRPTFILKIINEAPSWTVDRALIIAKNDVGIHYTEQLSLFPEEGYDQSLRQLTAMVTRGESADRDEQREYIDAVQGATTDVIDYAMQSELTVTGIMDDQALFDSLWVA